MPSSTPVDVAIIGGGPGGYVAALRAAQLGLDTVCIEKDRTLGGTCVNVGCIPSKALLTSSEHYEFAKQHAAEHGIKIEGSALSLDLATMLKRKDDVVGQNTRGIEFLFKKNRVAWAKGTGSLRRIDGRLEVSVTPSVGGPSPNDNMTSFAPKNVIIATGSVPIELPFLKFD
jgi:dihydrolipoamide dehydrogenase